MYNKNILILALVAIMSWTAWLVVLFKLSPNNHTELALLFFFLSLFFALFASFTIILFLIRYFFIKDDLSNRILNVSVRQGLLLSFLSIFILIFQLLRVLNWWTGILTIVLIAFLEYYFSYNESKLL